MNRQLNRLAVVSVVLLTALIVATTYWQAWAAGDLKAKQDNAIQRVVQFSIARGLIYGPTTSTVIATNRKVKQKGNTLYFRKYPLNGFAAQTIGYSTQSHAQTGLEESMNDYLTGSNTDLSNAFHNLLNKLGSATVHGDSLRLTLRPNAQKLAQRLLGDQCGAVVAMNPKTGAVYVMASSPTYNQNLAEQHYAQLLHIQGACHEASALLNRATQGRFTPGSTFKIVTAAAALDTGAYTPSSGFDDPGYCTEYGQKISNALNPDQSAESYGHVTLAQGLEHSINSVFCNIGMHLGAKTIMDYAKRFGFYKVPPLETPAGERLPSGLLKPGTGTLDDNFDHADPGRLAFGQFTLGVTPLQMCMVVAAIANGGIVPKPYLVQKIVGPDGSTIKTAHPGKLGRAIKPETAAELNQMMQLVVTGGTGTSAAIPGIKVAGKTGTAETGTNHVYTAWFVSFAPADNPKVAVAVVLEKQANGFGGAVAAPIAKQVMQALLGG
ncbi:MAG: penicillin-binding protein 2 [Actinomycetota bacterium]